ncbi:hypothetical protein J3E64_001352 [Sphingobium sp. OAS761]|uniref:DUF3325 family protein n=1 Tax=Sphingobium sp. OAS761 TaxID=2817901 RepID=UPI00209CDDD1|nr:DUF3325 family protein [Sphingobium sp. OAS761]MCP1469670.1 hypothetical protein [Sphingobium sp. OAS761]
MMALLAFLLLSAGFAALALSMAQHYRKLQYGAPAASRKLALRGAGWALLAAAFVPSIHDLGVSLGIVLWFGLAALAAAAAALILALWRSGRRA